MKSVIAYVLLMLLPSVGMAQHRAVQLEKPDWARQLVRAQNEGKYLLIDCNASWCMPCKKMVSEVFAIDSVADFYNAHFISVSYDIEHSEKMPFENLPEIRLVPTLLYVNPANKKVVYSVVGFQNKENLLKHGAKALDPASDIDAWRAKYVREGAKEEIVLPYLDLLNQARRMQEYNQVAGDYLKVMQPSQLIRLANWTLFEGFVSNPLSPLYQGAWNIRKTLSDAIGEKKVMEKFERTMMASAWRLVRMDERTKQVPMEDKEPIVAFLTSAEWKNRQWCIDLFRTDALATKEDWKGVLKELTVVVKNERPENVISLDALSLNVLKCFVERMSYGKASRELEKSLKLMDEYMKDKPDKIKSDVSSFKRDLYLRLGDKAAAARMDTLAVMYMNPHYYKK